MKENMMIKKIDKFFARNNQLPNELSILLKLENKEDVTYFLSRDMAVLAIQGLYSALANNKNMQDITHECVDAQVLFEEEARKTLN